MVVDMPGSPLNEHKGIIVGIQFYDSSPRMIDYLNMDEYSCLVNLDIAGSLAEKAIRAKWLKLLSRG